MSRRRPLRIFRLGILALAALVLIQALASVAIAAPSCERMSAVHSASTSCCDHGGDHGKAPCGDAVHCGDDCGLLRQATALPDVPQVAAMASAHDPVPTRIEIGLAPRVLAPPLRPPIFG